MTASPSEIASKWEAQWLAAKQRAISNYSAVADGIPDKIIAKKTDMVTNYTAALQGTALEDGLAKYRVSGVLASAYADSLNQITAFGASKVAKMTEDVTEKRALAGRVNEVIAVLKANTTSGTAQEPTGLTDAALRPLVMSAILHEQDGLSAESTAAVIFSAIQAYLISQYGFPTAA